MTAMALALPSSGSVYRAQSSPAENDRMLAPFLPTHKEGSGAAAATLR